MKFNNFLIRNKLFKMFMKNLEQLNKITFQIKVFIKKNPILLYRKFPRFQKFSFKLQKIQILT